MAGDAETEVLVVGAGPVGLSMAIALRHFGVDCIVVEKHAHTLMLESGDPAGKHYDDLMTDWLWGQYHQLPFSRKAVEAATEQRLTLLPRK